MRRKGENALLSLSKRLGKIKDDYPLQSANSYDIEYAQAILSELSKVPFLDGVRPGTKCAASVDAVTALNRSKELAEESCR